MAETLAVILRFQSRMNREFPPYLSYSIVTIMSVATLSMQVTLPFKIKALGGGFDTVGFLFTWTSFWYVISGMVLGRTFEHTGPRRVMLVALTICAAMVLLMPWATSVRQLYVLATIYYVSLCLYWAAMEHASTGLHERFSLIQSTAIFCVAFSVGNIVGTLVSATLQGQTMVVPFIVSTALTAVVIAIAWGTVPQQARFHRSTQADVQAYSDEARARVKRSLLATRTAMVGVYGAYALLMVFLPRYLWEELGFSKPLAGSLTSLTLVAMAATFAMHGLGKHWPHKLLPVRLCPVGAASGVLLVGSSASIPVIALGAIIVGAAAATGYIHNLCYSLEEPGRRARNAGIHEALVGAAFMVPPAISGLATRWTSEPRTIFWVGASLAVAFGLVQNFALMIARKKS
jgi:MFS family permease